MGQLRSLNASIHAVAPLEVIASHHQLLRELSQKDFDARYAGSFVGRLSIRLYPLLLFGVCSFVFSAIFSNSFPDLLLFLLVGIAIWSFFSCAILLATGSVIADASLSAKIGFPQELVSISVVLVALLDLAISRVILLAGGLS